MDNRRWENGGLQFGDSQGEQEKPQSGTAALSGSHGEVERMVKAALRRDHRDSPGAAAIRKIARQIKRDMPGVPSSEELVEAVCERILAVFGAITPAGSPRRHERWETLAATDDSSIIGTRHS